MRVFFSRLIKPLLALTAAALMAQSLSACSKTPSAAEKSTQGTATAEAVKPAEVTRGPDGVRTVAITVTAKGYEPSPITLKQGEPVKLVVTRTEERTCATEVVMEEYGIDTKLPLNTPVEIAFTPKKSGELTYGCAMGKMISGTFLVE